MLRSRLLLLLMLAVCAHAAEDEAVVAIHLRTELASPRAKLGDVATITADKELAALLAAIPVAELPSLTPVSIDVALVRALATRAAAPAVLRIEGAGTVVRQARSFTAADLAAAAGATLPTDATWELLRASGGITAPAGPALHLVAEPIDPTASGDVAFRIRALEDKDERGRALVVLRVARWAEVLVAARDLVRGQAVGPGDLRLERRVLDRANQAATGIDPDSLSGQIASRDLPAGAVVPRSLIVIPPVVRAGTAVSAVWPGKGFAVEVSATALSDARTGERVAMRRASDGTVLHGIAQADGTVVVER